MSDLINSKKETIENTVLQKNFEIFSKIITSLKRPLNLKIANSFLKINQRFIN